ncbi:hypothetical protein BC962_3229 [Gillisia mitskevichiae]|uniref:Uncharacterized protein n=1 Tax=Gillisia mitskevichiae TaxID=270921 RepID=A0A495NZI0_9FLAO|nr:hypothetical protein [Gillisia mitskevichiae]RKS42562.1 hypothetical protein BC962_3229 [Gillisia mitskevichiae]
MKNLKQRTLGAMIGGLMFVIIFTILSGDYTFSNISIWAIAGFLVSVLIGFIFPFLLGKLSPKLN